MTIDTKRLRTTEAGMTLDEAEKLARDLAEDDTGCTNKREWHLARALLAVLPVVRAAEAQVKAWSRWESSRHHTQEELHTSLDASKALEDAIDEMRKRLAEGG